MYLFDYYHSKIVGSRATQLPWKFIYYGPYCSEVMRDIDLAVQFHDIDKKEYDSKFDIDKDFSIYRCYDSAAEKIQETINIFVLSKIQWAIKKFGDDTAQLLDYVYFDTEPMKNSYKGSLLDFSVIEKAQPSKRIIKKELSKAEIEKAKSLISKMGKKYIDGSHQIAIDNERANKFKNESYYQFLQILETSDQLPSFDGIATIEL